MLCLGLLFVLRWKRERREKPGTKEKGGSSMSVKESITPEQLAIYTELVKEKKALRKKSNKGSWFFLLICFVFGGCLGGFAVYLMETGVDTFKIRPPFPIKDGLELLYVFAGFAWFYFTTMLHVIIHEAGHLVFGLLTGYGFLSFRVFSFTLVKKDGKIIRKKLKVTGIPGQCLLTPPEWKEDGKYPYVWYNLGGGMLNLITCLLAALLFLTHSPLVYWGAGIFILTGVILGLTNMIPMSMGVPNDGKNCLLCAKSRDNQRAFYLQLKINAMMSDGVAVKDMPEEFFEINGEKPLNPLTFFVGLMKYYRYLQMDEFEQAKEWLATVEQQVEKLPLAFVNSFDLERIYCMLREDAPLEEVAATRAVLMPVFLQNKDLSILRVKYAYCALLTEEERELIDWLVYSKKGKLPKKLPKSKSETAEQIYEDMEKALAKHPVIGEAEMYMDLAKNL